MVTADKKIKVSITVEEATKALSGILSGLKPEVSRQVLVYATWYYQSRGLFRCHYGDMVGQEPVCPDNVLFAKVCDVLSQCRTSIIHWSLVGTAEVLGLGDIFGSGAGYDALISRLTSPRRVYNRYYRPIPDNACSAPGRNRAGRNRGRRR